MTYVSFFKLVLVGGRVCKRAFSSVTLRTKDIQKYVRVSAGCPLLPCVNLDRILNHCNAITQHADSVV